MVERKETNEVVFHHAKFRGDVSAETVRSWHMARGWSDIGYHFVVRLDGSIESGRSQELMGAHDLYNNDDSIGILIVGDFEYDVPTAIQLEVASGLFAYLEQVYNKKLKHSYHRDPGEGNPCPGIKFPREYFDNLLEYKSNRD